MSQMDNAIEAIKLLFSQRDEQMLAFKRDEALFKAAIAFNCAIVDSEKREVIRLEEVGKKGAEERTHLKQNEPGIVAVATKNRPHRISIVNQPKKTISTFAADLGMSVNSLLKQFASAGIEKRAPDDAVSEQDKSRLLDFLHKAHGNGLIKVKATQPRKQTENTTAHSCSKANSSDKISKGIVGIETGGKLVPPAASPLPAPRPEPVPSINYNWPRHASVNPYDHQIKTTEFLVQHDKAFCLNDMGTGKTLSVLWAYDYLRQRGEAHSMLIICPLSTMVSTWQAEICKHFRLGSKILHGVDGAARRKALGQPAHIYIINHDGFTVAGMLEALIARTDIDVVVIDEIASFRNAGTDRWKSIRRVIEGRKHVWGLTGTPIPNKPTDAWAQCRLIAPSKVPLYFGRFREMVERKVSQFKWVTRENALAIVQDAMQPSIRYKRDECIDLPPVVYETHKIELTEAQAQAYKQMRLQLHAEIDGKVITAVNACVMATKLLQIACGAVLTNATGDDRVAFIPAENRLTLVKEIIEDAGGSVIVFVPFRGVLAYVAEFLSKAFSVAAIHGGVSRGDRERIFDDFQNKKTVRILVSIPHAMSHGLNLTAANTIIWFGPIYSNDVYQQANARITRPGQKRSQLIVNIEGTVAEQVIYKGLRNKQKMQDLLLEMLA